MGPGSTARARAQVPRQDKEDVWKIQGPFAFIWKSPFRVAYPAPPQVLLVILSAQYSKLPVAASGTTVHPAIAFESEDVIVS
jgi:hypothetical protein